jgi:hypothetical protein
MSTGGKRQSKREDDVISGDRRCARRYALGLDLNYKVTRGKRVLETGAGRTEDISSGGVAFAAGRPLPVGSNAELMVEWPMPLNGHPLRLVISGRIVRNEGRIAAIRIDRHEFRLGGVRRPGGGLRWSFGGPAEAVNGGGPEAKPARPELLKYARR